MAARVESRLGAGFRSLGCSVGLELAAESWPLVGRLQQRPIAYLIDHIPYWIAAKESELIA